MHASSSYDKLLAKNYDISFNENIKNLMYETINISQPGSYFLGIENLQKSNVMAVGHYILKGYFYTISQFSFYDLPVFQLLPGNEGNINAYIKRDEKKKNVLSLFLQWNDIISENKNVKRSQYN